MRGRVEHDRVAAHPRREPADVRAPQRLRAAERRRRRAPRPRSCACRAPPARCRTPSRSCSSSPGCSWSRSRPSPRRRAPAARRDRAGGWRSRSPAGRWRPCRRRRARRRRRRRGSVQWSTEAAPSSTASRTPGPGSELVAVHAQAEAGGRARLEHGPRLVGVERALLAEDVDPAAVRRAGGEHLAADELDVLVGAALVLGRDDVGAEEGDVVGQPGRHRTAALLGGDVEPVAGLDLDVGDAGAQRLARGARPPARRARRCRGSRRLGGHADPAGLVRRARHPRRELVAAVAGEDEVRVAVDEAGDHAAPGGVEALVRGRARRARRPPRDRRRGPARRRGPGRAAPRPARGRW